MKKFATSLELLNYMRQNLKINANTSYEELDNLVQKFSNLLKYDEEGHLRLLYEAACKGQKHGWYDIVKVKYNLLLGKFRYVKFQNLTFDFNIDFYKELEFDYCDFENITISEKLREFYENYNISFFQNNNFKNITFLNSDLRYSDVKKERLGNSIFTTHVNLYVELDRICNAKCSFCRNNYYEKKTYDFKRVKKSINKMYNYTTDIVIGGGEPTLHYEDLVKLSKKPRLKNQIIISSNLSANPDIIWHLVCNFNYSFLVSRHAIDTDENAEIFKFNETQRINSETNLLNLSNTEQKMISTVCFKGGIDTEEKLYNYIIWAIELGYTNILIQTLHQDNTFGTNEFDVNSQKIDTSFIKNVAHKLIIKEHLEVEPTIYSTAGYKSTVIKNRYISIAFKEYLTKEEFEQFYPTAYKRTIDLSISPDGTIYENWHQNSGEIQLVKKNSSIFRK